MIDVVAHKILIKLMMLILLSVIYSLLDKNSRNLRHSDFYYAVKIGIVQYVSISDMKLFTFILFRLIVTTLMEYMIFYR
jgi:hypothetical protein